MRGLRVTLLLVGSMSAVMGLTLVGCGLSPVRDQRLTLCEFVRAAVADGSLPLDIARARYPECNAVQTTP